MYYIINWHLHLHHMEMKYMELITSSSLFPFMEKKQAEE